MRHTIETARATALARNGRFLSSEFSTAQAKYIWMCDQQHSWMSSLTNILSGRWCPSCANRRKTGRPRKYTKEDAIKVAQDRGGAFLSQSYTSTHTKYIWKCSLGHEWLTDFSTILRGCWCPECSASLGERLCRAAFEQIFASAFPTTHPSFLRTDLHSCLELDGYSERLGIAFEHQGVQHYKPCWGFTQEDVAAIQQRDLLKKTLCAENSVALIVIPDLFNMTPLKALKEHIKNQCSDLQISLPSDFEDLTIDYSKAYKDPKQNIIDHVSQLVAERHGKISKINFKERTFIEVTCKNNHAWTTTYGHLLERKWCRICAKKQPHTLEKMKELAIINGGKCLSLEYKNNVNHLVWVCKENHIWFATSRTVLNNKKWCPYCERNIPLIKAQERFAVEINNEYRKTDHRKSSD